ncbi:hypothetical protein E4T39_04610 [Aureobasidium subglaciale]|nr:hypothetical protein E4T39_04610 [Aureobasidium subglaciale]
MQFLLRALLVLRWLFLASASPTVSSPLCDKIREDGKVTAAHAKDSIAPWAQKQFEEWTKSNASEGEAHFWTWLHQKWAPDAAGSIADCKLSKECSVVTCQFISDKYDMEDQVNAYWTLESLANFHNMAYEIKDANEKAWLSVRGEIGALTDKFSDGRNIEAHKERHDKRWRIIGHVVTTTALTISSLCTLLTAGAGIGLFGLAMSGTETVMIGSQAVSKAVITAIGAESGMIGTLAVGANGFGGDFMGGKDYVSKLTTTLTEAQKANQDRVQDKFDAFVLELFSGKFGSKSDNSTLVQLIGSGRYLHAENVFTPEHNAAFRHQWAQSYVSSIWNVERTYIVMADVKGSCESDSRGYRKLRVCLEEDPHHVFYAFSKSHVKEGTAGQAYLRGPIGYDQLETYANVTLKDVVRASYVAAKQEGSHPSKTLKAEDMVEDFWSEKNIKEGGKAHGMFNVPILYSPGGEAISSINSKKNRNYPCMAAALPWFSKPGHGGSSENTLESRRKHRGSWTKNDPATMFQFLNVTGLYQSKDWWKYCNGRFKHHGNHCRGNKAISWQGKFGAGQFKKIRHPFKHCTPRGHKFKGCEQPHNNGFKANKCGGKKKGGKGDKDDKSGKAGVNTEDMEDIGKYDPAFGTQLGAADHNNDMEEDMTEAEDDVDEGNLSEWSEDESDAEDNEGAVGISEYNPADEYEWDDQAIM